MARCDVVKDAGFGLTPVLNLATHNLQAPIVLPACNRPTGKILPCSGNLLDQPPQAPAQVQAASRAQARLHIYFAILRCAHRAICPSCVSNDAREAAGRSQGNHPRLHVDTGSHDGDRAESSRPTSTFRSTALRVLRRRAPIDLARGRGSERLPPRPAALPRRLRGAGRACSTERTAIEAMSQSDRSPRSAGRSLSGRKGGNACCCASQPLRADEAAAGTADGAAARPPRPPTELLAGAAAQPVSRCTLREKRGPWATRCARPQTRVAAAAAAPCRSGPPGGSPSFRPSAERRPRRLRSLLRPRRRRLSRLGAAPACERVERGGFGGFGACARRGPRPDPSLLFAPLPPLPLRGLSADPTRADQWGALAGSARSPGPRRSATSRATSSSGSWAPPPSSWAPGAPERGPSPCSSRRSASSWSTTTAPSTRRSSGLARCPGSSLKEAGSLCYDLDAATGQRRRRRLPRARKRWRTLAGRFAAVVLRAAVVDSTVGGLSAAQRRALGGYRSRWIEFHWPGVRVGGEAEARRLEAPSDVADAPNDRAGSRVRRLPGRACVRRFPGRIPKPEESTPAAGGGGGEPASRPPVGRKQRGRAEAARRRGPRSLAPPPRPGSPMRSRPWGFKAPAAIVALPLLQRFFPAMRVVHVLRDGRDIALSSNRNQAMRYYNLLEPERERVRREAQACSAVEPDSSNRQERAAGLSELPFLAGPRAPRGSGGNVLQAADEAAAERALLGAEQRGGRAVRRGTRHQPGSRCGWRIWSAGTRGAGGGEEADRIPGRRAAAVGCADRRRRESGLRLGHGHVPDAEAAAAPREGHAPREDPGGTWPAARSRQRSGGRRRCAGTAPLSGVRGETTQERANNAPQREEPEPATTKDDGRLSGGGATEDGETANEAAVTGRYGKWRSELRDAHREWFHVIEGQVSAGLEAFGYRLAAAETAQPLNPTSKYHYFFLPASPGRVVARVLDDLERDARGARRPNRDRPP